MRLYKLKDICHIEKGKQIDTDNLSEDNSYKYINGGIKESGYYYDYNTEGNTITVSEGGASCGYVNYMTEKFWCGCHCYRLTECKFNSKYIYYALKGNQSKIMALRTGAAMPNIKKSTFETLELTLTSNEQEQINIIEKFEKIDSLIENTQNQLTKLDNLIKSRFIEMFGDPVYNTNKLPTKKLYELGVLERGKSQHRPRNAPELLNGPYPLIQTGDVANTGLYITQYNNTYSELGLSQSKMWKAGTLCITIAANIAQTAILSFDACFPDSVVGFCSNGEISAIYLHYWFGFFQKILEEQAPQVAQKNINLKILSDLDVMLPNKNEQEDFISFVESTDKLKFEVKQSLEKLETLKRALMQKYFG